jgi:UPF0042 nucleotide-binding protein
VLSQAGALEFVESYTKALQPVLDGYLRENKHYATIAIGCTGGKHRSVAVSIKIAELLSKKNEYTVTVRHRDLGKE